MASDESSAGVVRPDVYEVPGAVNHYKYDHNVVVLDSRLEEYPDARELIKTHEFAHAEARTTPEYLALELRADARRHFSTSDEIEEVREYYSEIDRPERLSDVTEIGFSFVDFLRGLWNLVMSPLGSLYRRWTS